MRMKSLTEEMQDKSHMLSLALSLSTIVILIGIFGLVVVANHRQKRKRQLKAILRAKNLGPVLESRKIAREVSKNFLPKYTVQKKPSMASSKLPMNTPDIEEPSKPAKASKWGDMNELLSAIMYRMRKADYAEDPDKEIPPMVMNSISPIPDAKETSFYYKESSLTTTSSEEETSRNISSGMSTRGTKGGKDTPDNDGDTETDDQSSQAGSYVSKISQKVFVHQEHSRPPTSMAPKPPRPPSTMPPPPGHYGDYPQRKVTASNPAGNFQGELKEKCMTFFSSVTRSKREEELGWDNPTYAASKNSKTKL